MLDVDRFLTCFGSAASAFENIELGYIHCALKENFSVTLKGFTCVSLICRELLVHSVPSKHKVQGHPATIFGRISVRKAI